MNDGRNPNTARHFMVLTDRNDLTKDFQRPNGRGTSHPCKSVSGILSGLEGSNFKLITPEHGEVTVTGVSFGDDDVSKDTPLVGAIGKQVDIMLGASATPNKQQVTVLVKGEPIFQRDLSRKPSPSILMPSLAMYKPESRPISGKLMHTYFDSGFVELKDAKGNHAIAYHFNMPSKEHQAEIQKLIGKQVWVIPGEKLQVVAMEKEKSMGIS